MGPRAQSSGRTARARKKIRDAISRSMRGDRSRARTGRRYSGHVVGSRPGRRRAARARLHGGERIGPSPDDQRRLLPGRRLRQSVLPRPRTERAQVRDLPPAREQHEREYRRHPGARGAVARGQALFNTLVIPIAGVSGVNDDFGGPGNFDVPIVGTCTTCHDTPNAGDHSVPAPRDIGVADPPVSVAQGGDGVHDRSGCPSATCRSTRCATRPPGRSRS